MNLPQAFLKSLEGITGFDKEAFVAMHEREESITSIRINSVKQSAMGNRQSSISNSEGSGIHSPFTTHHSPVPWCATGFYLAQRPSFTFDPFFHAGCYYVQEASSMFLEQAFAQLLDLSQPLKVLDLCAAPGGKSTHIQSLLSAESLLVSNEVIKQRSYVLSDNVIKWGCQNVFVTNNDPKAFQNIPGYFDVIVVDAPCSGSGLFRRDEEAISEWSLNNVALCSQRQQRILADALPTLKRDGILIYSTCSYSAEEDETIMDWLVQEMEMENISLNIEAFRGIVFTTSQKAAAVGYRFYPDKVKGEGFFIACFRKRKEDQKIKLRPSKPEAVSPKEKNIIRPWVTGNDFHYVKFRDDIIALSAHLITDFSLLQPLLNIQYAGVKMGTVLKDKLVPHHALSQSTILSFDVTSTELSYDEAIRYLQRADLSITTQITGWQAVRYNGYSLGWINALPNRVNNYYPKEIRILKAHNNTPFKK